MYGSVFRAIFLFALISTGVFAEGNQKKLTLNIYGGFSFTSNSGDNTAGGLNARNGLGYGLGLEYRVQKKFAIGIDMLNLFKGYEERVGNTVTYYNVNYLEIPLMLKYYVIENNLCFQGGPFLPSLIISASRDSGGESTPLKDRFGNDFGMSVGVWFGFMASNILSVGVDLRYDYGMIDIQADASPESSVRTRALVGMLRFGFALK